MTAALILLGYAAVLVVAGPRLPARSNWTERAPKLGVIAWQTLSASAVVSVALAGVALVAPALRVGAGPAGLLRACVMALCSQYAAPGGAVVAVLGATAARRPSRSAAGRGPLSDAYLVPEIPK